jgi:hypothetical protein
MAEPDLGVVGRRDERAGVVVDEGVGHERLRSASSEVELEGRKVSSRQRKSGPFDVGERDELENLGHLLIIGLARQPIEPLPEHLGIRAKQLEGEELTYPLLLGIVRGSRRRFGVERRDGAVGNFDGGLRQVEVGGGDEESAEGGAGMSSKGRGRSESAKAWRVRRRDVRWE